MNQPENIQLFAEERKNEILQIVTSRGKILVPELVERFHVSPATIRNDLRNLEAAGLIKRTHGGCMPVDALKAGFEVDRVHKMPHHTTEKQAIAREAELFIDEGDIILLDTGSTTLELAKRLIDRKNLTIIVNDIEIANMLESSENHIIIIGGSIRRRFHCTVGPLATQMLSDINVDKVFLGTNGLSLTKGCTTPDLHQAEVKKQMIAISKQVILLCDGTKIGKHSFIKFAPLSEIDLLITDSQLSNEMHTELSAQGINVVVAQLS